MKQYNLDVAHLCKYSADSTNVNFEMHSVYELRTKESGKLLPVKCPAYLVHNTD